MSIEYVFDGGHGGKDSGAVGNGLYEKNIVLYLVKKAKEIIERDYEGIKITLTRSKDVFVELGARTDLANKMKADGLVSFHVNSAESEKASGYETWIYTKVGAETKKLANDIHGEVMKVYDGTDRGIKAGNLHMLRESHMKSTLLEFFFIKNKSDAAKLKDTAYLDKLALAVVKGIAKHEGLKKKPTPVKTPSKPSVSDGTMYYVQVGAFGSKANAEAYAKKVEAEGFKTTIKTN